MRRTITLVSIAATAFTVVIMVTVIYGYRVNAQPHSTSRVAALEPGLSPELMSASSVPTTRITARNAAAIASEFLARTDAFAVELVEYDGVQAYKVTFSSGDVVYVSLEGKVLGAEPPTITVAVVTKKEREREYLGDGHEGNDHESEGEERESEGEEREGEHEEEDD